MSILTQIDLPFLAGLNSGPVTSGLTLWLKGDAGITLTSGKVSTWADQSGNGRDFTQSSSSNRPSQGTQNGLSTVKFRFGGDDGVTKNLDRTDTWATFIGTNSTAYDVWIVFKGTSYGDGSSPHGINMFTDNDTRVGVGFSTIGGTSGFTVINTHAGETTQFNVSTALSEWHTGEMRNNSGSFQLFLDGTPGTGATVQSAITSGTPMHIGKSDTTAFFGEIGEILVYNRALSSTEQTKNVNYLKRWGTP